jgi:uncharacterized protein (UPF0147 family)
MKAERIKNRLWMWKDNGEIIDAANLINKFQQDCERADQRAEEANNILDQIYSDSNMDYGDYSRLFDAIAEIVNWEVL